MRLQGPPKSPHRSQVVSHRRDVAHLLIHTPGWRVPRPPGSPSSRRGYTSSPVGRKGGGRDERTWQRSTSRCASQRQVPPGCEDVEMRLRSASFVRSIDPVQPVALKTQNIDFATGAFLSRHENVLLVRRTGDGKSHVALALGHRAPAPTSSTSARTTCSRRCASSAKLAGTTRPASWPRSGRRQGERELQRPRC